MDSYITAEQERRRQGQLFGTADELRVLRTINARANAMRRMAGNRAARQAVRVTGRPNVQTPAAATTPAASPRVA